MLIFDPGLFILIVSVYINLFFGLFILLKNSPSRSAQLLFFFTFITALWCVVSYISYFYQDLFSLIWVLRLTIFLGLLQGLGVYALARSFPLEKFKFNKWEIFIFLPIYGIILGICWTDLFFKSVAPMNGLVSGIPYAGNSLVSVPGVLMPLFAISSILLIVSSVTVLIMKILAKKSKVDIKLLLAGVVTMFTFIITFNFIFPTVFLNSNFVGYSPIFSLPFVVFAFYGILREQSFDVKTIFTEVLVYIFWSIILLFIFTQNTDFGRVISAILFIFSVVLGLLLIKSVRKEVEDKEKIESQKKTLEVLVRTKDEAMHLVNHQVNTPLSIIKSAVAMYRDKLWDEKKFLETLVTQTERLSETVAEFLLAKKVEMGQMGVQKVDVDLVTLVEKLIEEKKLLKKVRLGNMNFEFQKFAEVVKVKLDVGAMTEVISNLLDNAVSYSQHNIIVKLEQVKNRGRRQSAKEKIMLSVKDSGIGIPPDSIDKLFNRFVRLDNAKNAKPDGTGLGLYVCKQIVEAHGGKIWVESDGEGKGSTFKVLF